MEAAGGGNYGAEGVSACSMACTTSGDSGVVREPKRATTRPVRSIRNLLKFHVIAPLQLVVVAGSVSQRYSGCWPSPLTTIRANIGKVTP